MAGDAPRVGRAPGAPLEDAEATLAESSADASYSRGARILAAGIGLTGVVTFLYFSLASHELDDDAYGQISLLWSILFITVTVIYRPVEQLLSRTIASRRAAGAVTGHPLRTAGLVQLGFAALFLVVALVLRGPLEDGLGSSTLFWVLVGAALAYGASYFARGYVAGHKWFGLYGGLVFFEATARVCFPLACVLGLASGQTVVALGILAAPLASLLVVPWAIRRHRRDAAHAGDAEAVDHEDETMRSSASFATSVAGIQLAEQALLNVAVLLVPAGAVAGVVFNAFLITRVPLQLFQSVQTSLLPHLAGTTDPEAFSRAIRRTCAVMAGLAGAVVVGLVAIGPWVMDIPFDDDVTYGRWGLAAIGVGMGFHLVAGTLNQAALARRHDRAAAACWLVSAGAFVAWMLAAVGDDPLTRAQVGYLGATVLLAGTLYGVYRRG